MRENDWQTGDPVWGRKTHYVKEREVPERGKEEKVLRGWGWEVEKSGKEKRTEKPSE